MVCLFAWGVAFILVGEVVKVSTALMPLRNQRNQTVIGMTQQNNNYANLGRDRVDGTEKESNVYLQSCVFRR